MSQSGASSRPYQDPLETWTEKFSRKFKENPWVPIGCVATCGALIMAAVKLRTGKSKQMNYWLRARVGLQGATVVALLMGSTWGQEWVRNNFGKEDPIAAIEETGLSKELKREKERMEFEERLREAQAATEEEEMLRTRTDNGFANGPSTVEKGKGEVAEAVKKSNGWRLWKSSGSQEGENSSKTQ